MGGRRARSVSEIVGAGNASLKRKLGKALAQQDPQHVAETTARLVAAGEKTIDILYYASRLASFVRRAVESGEELSYAERETVARREWSRIKREEHLPDDPIATRALVAAVAGALARGKR